MKIYIHTSGKRNQEFQTEPSATIDQIVKEFLKHSGIAYDDSWKVYLQGESEPLNPAAGAGKQKVKENDHLHLTRCKKIAVTVTYNGRQFERDYPAAQTFEKVRKEAIKHFEIPDQDAARLELFKDQDAQDAINLDDHVGMYGEFPTCGYMIYLTVNKNVLG